MMAATSFEQAYPVVIRAACARAASAVARRAVPAIDGDDLQQQGIIACWRALPQFEPTRASLRTFIERVIAGRLATLARSARRAPSEIPIKACHVRPVESCAAEQELRTDIQGLLKLLDGDDRRIVLLLLEFTPSEASRKLGISRSTLYVRISRLRETFAAAGLAPAGYHPNGGTR